MDGRIEQVFRNVFDSDSVDIRDDLTSSDIPAWDSLAHVRVLIALEEEFGVKFSVDELVQMASVGDIKRALTSKGVAASREPSQR